MENNSKSINGITLSPTSKTCTAKFYGEGIELFLTLFVNAILTMFTLGIYAAWGKLKVYQFFYSNTEFANHRFRFTGTGKGKMRKLYHILANINVILFTSLIIASPKSNETETSYEKLYSNFLNLGKGDVQGTAAVQNLELRREAAVFSFETGQFILLAAINNRPAALLFMGNGTFRFTPPTEIESEQLARFYQKDSLNEEFETLFLLFNDSTYQELSRKVNFDSTKIHISRKVKSKIKNCLDYLHEDKNKSFNTSIMKSFLDERRDGLFYAHMRKGRAKPLFFKIDPYKVEEVRLMRRANYGHLHDVAEVVSQFHLEKYYLRSKIPSWELKSLIKIHHTEIEASVKNNLGLDFSARATVEFSLRQQDQTWVYFTLFKDLKVDSLYWDNGSNATFFQGKENPRVWVELDSAVAANAKMKLVFYYHGDLLKRSGDGRIAIRSSSHWHPIHGSREPSTYDLTFHFPSKFEVFSVGNKISEGKKKKVRTSRWLVDKPINFASFSLGDYKKHSFDDDKTLSITVLASDQSRNIKDVAGDVINSMALFNDIFGPYPVENLFVTETPYPHGEAFRGLIHLSASTLKSTGSKGYDEVFRGHEVAHQWWGIEVDYQTYHDKWLSEGLSDFAGLRYMQTILQKKKGTKKYFNILEDWQKQILENRKYIFGKGQEAGPIWLGYRTSSTKTKGDYGLIIYKKGAWVFHMLRMMFLDLKNMSNEEAFNKMMRDYYSRFRGKKASTIDFQKVVEEHLGMDMDWFFRQWVFRTEIPQYSFAYKTEQTPAGKFLIKAKVRQTNVSEAFKMPIIFKIDFGKQGSYTTRKFVTGAESEIELLLAPIKPKKVVFNYLKSALCEQKTKKWK